MDTSVSDSTPKGRRATLEALRDRLAAILDGTAGHLRGCDCDCGTPWDAGKVAPIARELREVLAQLEDLPTAGNGESEIERARREREQRLAAAREARQEA
jgi:hypothetical protein